MKEDSEKRKAYRDRVLNASYGLEVEQEEAMIAKLKAEYKAFDHRPMESKIELPPYILDSQEYRIRHMELRGGAKVPTALYGMVRFRDLLNEHESMITEAARSREYAKFVNDRLAGFQAWKNTLEREGQIHEEIRKEIDPAYFAEYNEFMDKFNYLWHSTPKT